MKALPPPPNPIQAIKNSAMVLRQIATGPDPMRRIAQETCFQLGGIWFHNDDHEAEAAPDRCVPHPVTGQVLLPARSLSPMDLIDDACAFELIADKIDN